MRNSMSSFPPDLPSDSHPSVFCFFTCLQICPCPFRLKAVASIRFAERASSRQGGGEEYRSGHVVTQIRIGLSTSFVHFKAIGIHPLPSALISRKSVFGISPRRYLYPVTATSDMFGGSCNRSLGGGSARGGKTCGRLSRFYCLQLSKHLL